jgi:hypothetical protein
MRTRRRGMLVVGGAAAVAATAFATVALATPSSGTTAAPLSRGTLQGDVVFDTDHARGDGTITWFGTQWSAERLPQFLAALRSHGTTDLGEWLRLHPGAAAKLGLTPVATMRSPEVVKQTITYPAGAHSGWHSLSGGYLTATVVSGEVVRYDQACAAQKLTAGQSFHQTGANTFIVKNQSGAGATLTATYVFPGGTPTPGSCSTGRSRPPAASDEDGRTTPCRSRPAHDTIHPNR